MASVPPQPPASPRPPVVATPSSRATLPKSSRLLRRRDFVRVQGRGRKLSDGILLALALPRGDGGPARLGITVSSKVGNAVHRARIRRQVREAFRHRRSRFPAGVDVVVIARDAARTAPHDAFQRAFDALLRRMAQVFP